MLHRKVRFFYLLTSYRPQPLPNFEPHICYCEQVFHAIVEDLQSRHCFAHASIQLANKTRYFRTSTKNIYHPELCEGLHQNERSHFVRSVSSSKLSFLCIGERTMILQDPRFDLVLDCLLPKIERILYSILDLLPFAN